MALATNTWGDGYTYTGATGTVGPFVILGGKYLFFATAAGTSNTLEMLMPDGTYIAVGSTTTFSTSAATAMIDLPPGTYQNVVVTSTAVAGGLVRIPYRAA
jgi:hypothetical protein